MKFEGTAGEVIAQKIVMLIAAYMATREGNSISVMNNARDDLAKAINDYIIEPASVDG